MNTKIWAWVVIIILIILGIYWYVGSDGLAFKPAGDTNEAGRVVGSEVETQTGKLRAATFSGELEEVNTGCFADAECYVVVDGRHVTAIMGWSQEIVGSVEGVEGFGDLENHIGEEVEVYAQDKGDGTYTLYGSEGFYIELK